MQKRKLTAEQVLEIRQLAATSMKKVDIARKYNISPQLISTVIRYGYDSRPTRDRRKMPEGFSDWNTLARQYNLLYPDEAPITGNEAQRIHDLALKKMRMWFDSRGKTMSDWI
jgi:hypothetical protein